jgi:hypothetical protein
MKKNKKIFTQVAQTAIDQFLVSRNFRRGKIEIHKRDFVTKRLPFALK